MVGRWGLGLAGIVIEPTADLLRLQEGLIDAVAPFTEKVGTAAAFVTTPEDPEINQPTIDYVAAFVPNETGKTFNPHVTGGIAPEPYLKEMLAKPFDNFASRLLALPLPARQLRHRPEEASRLGAFALNTPRSERCKPRRTTAASPAFGATRLRRDPPPARPAGGS